MTTTLESYFDVIHAVAPADEPEAEAERGELLDADDPADDPVAHAVLVASSFVPFPV